MNLFENSIEPDYNKPAEKSPAEVLLALEKEIAPPIGERLKKIEADGRLGDLDRELDGQGIALTYFKGIEEKLQPEVEKLLNAWLETSDKETKKKIIEKLAGSLESQSEAE